MKTISTAATLVGLPSLLGLAIQACVSIGPIAKVDKEQKKVELYSMADEKSAMPDMKKVSEVSAAANDLAAKVKREPTVESLLNLAQVHFVQERYGQAEETCRKALRMDLKNVEARKILAQIYLRTDRNDLALIVLNGLSEKATRDSQVHNLFALVAIKGGDMAEAMRHFKTALEVNPNDLAVRMNLGVLYLKFRQLNEASVQFERVLKVLPEHNDARLHLAVIKASRGDYKESEKVYREILAKKANNPLALYNLAVLESSRENFEEAVKALKSYLKTSYARNSDTTEAFTLIDDIQKRQEVRDGAKVQATDDDIQKMAAKLKAEPQNGAGEKSIAPTAEAMPSKASKSSSQKDDDELTKLENQLK